ncbi:MAG TPA: hypothetical protein VFG16_03960 [Streptomyces sp.]|nr:hypothetical protein [Streptomyces sp.]
MANSVVHADGECPRCRGPLVQQVFERSGWGGPPVKKRVGEPYCPDCSVAEIEQFEREQQKD